jgi:3-hydroxyisobutyrate dehydrogenase
MGGEYVPPERIGFIGLGNMGGPMALRLAGAGFTLAVVDAAPAAVARLTSQVACETPSSLTELGSCRVIITMLPDGKAVREVLLGHNGAAAALASGSVVIDMSSSSPLGTRKLGQDLAQRGITLIDAPVSGGVRKAVDGSLAIMAGGDPEVVERCRPMLEVLGRVFPAGPPGAGHAMKALNNYLSAANLAIAAEAVIAGQRFGLEPDVMISILNASTGRNSATDQKYPAYVLPRNFASGFAIGLMAKDLRLALEVAGASGAPSTLLKVCAQLWSAAEQRLGSRADNTEIVKYLEALPPAHLRQDE